MARMDAVGRELLPGLGSGPSQLRSRPELRLEDLDAQMQRMVALAQELLLLVFLVAGSGA